MDTDLPLIQILSVCTDFFTLEFGKIQIFQNKIRRNTDFFLECQRFFLILSIFIQIFFIKYRLFWSFILILCQIIVAGLWISALIHTDRALHQIYYKTHKIMVGLKGKSNSSIVVYVILIIINISTIIM